MSEQPPPPGWWLASDGKYYPPASPLPASTPPGWWLASDGKYYPPPSPLPASTSPLTAAPPTPSSPLGPSTAPVTAPAGPAPGAWGAPPAWGTTSTWGSPAAPRMQPARPAPRRPKWRARLWGLFVGMMWIVLGITITVVTINLNFPVYIAATGPIIFGLFRIARALVSPNP